MYTIRKLFKFEGAHILDSSYSKECQCVHGHSYKVEVFISSENLNEDGMIIDFKLLSKEVSYIINQWDHKLLVSEYLFSNRDLSDITGVLVVRFNPTAENMCKYIYDAIMEEMRPDFKLKVRIHETDTGWAEYYE